MDTKGLTAACRDEVPFGSWSELKDAKKNALDARGSDYNHEHHLYIQAHHYIIRSGGQNARI